MGTIESSIYIHITNHVINEIVFIYYRINKWSMIVSSNDLQITVEQIVKTLPIFLYITHGNKGMTIFFKKYESCDIGDIKYLW